MITFSQLSKISRGNLVQFTTDKPIGSFLTDSRKAIYTETACFFAIRGNRHNGHDHIAALYNSGLRQFVVEEDLDWKQYPLANFFLSGSTITVLQELAAYHRKQFKLPVIGITGSNAKTILKEWLSQLLSPDQSIVKNPGSYNSQLGVPLSVLQINEHHQLGIFEAGISQPGEMISLKKIIDPTIGIFTNIGSSHDEGFKSRAHKVQEKLALFENCKTIVYCYDHEEVRTHITNLSGKNILAWGKHPAAPIQVKDSGNNVVSVVMDGVMNSYSLPFIDTASVENLLHCIVVMTHLGVPAQKLQERILSLKSVPMRLELKQGINQSMVIDDTYNNDLAGLRISLEFLMSQQKSRKYLILSDILQSGMEAETLMTAISTLMKGKGLTHFYGIGPLLHANQKSFRDIVPHTQFFLSTEDFIKAFPSEDFQSGLILVKGARTFRFEQIVQKLQRKIHGTVIEIDLSAVVHNLNYVKSLLQPGVKLMVMVKALAYGSGSEEVANLLQYHQVDYLGVAYADEGVELRKNRISLPIMVMNPSEDSFPTLIENNLEPEIYSMKLLQSFSDFLGQQKCRVHLKVDTGMHRLGFDEQDLPELLNQLRQRPGIRVASVFSHLAGADEPQHDAFTAEQAGKFEKFCEALRTGLGYDPVRHILNSPGILRFPAYQYGMVRLGIGLYGINPSGEAHPTLRPVATLKTIISQIRRVKRGDSIGYGRKGKAEAELMLATIAIGYADGFTRRFSGGRGVVLVNGKHAPVVGNVCMDMTMVDITGIDAKEGDEVIVFGPGLSLHEVADRAQTIPYEILTSTSERVKRVFHTESF